MAIRTLGPRGYRLEEGGLIVPLFPGIELLYAQNQLTMQKIADELCYIPPVWFGMEDGLEASSKLLQDIAEMPVDNQIAEKERALSNHDEEIEYQKRRMLEAREIMNEHKLRRNEVRKRLAELKTIQANGGFEVTDEDVENLARYLERVKSVLGVRVDNDGQLVVLVRTAIASQRNGDLYDMGDFEIILGVRGEVDYVNLNCNCNECMRNNARANENKRLRLNLRCVRLPNREKGYVEDYGVMYRLWFEGVQTLKRRDNGEYYVEGGYFCFGSRQSAIDEALSDNNVRAVLDLVIASLNDTQNNYHHEVENYGALIPEDRVDSFYMIST